MAAELPPINPENIRYPRGARLYFGREMDLTMQAMGWTHARCNGEPVLEKRRRGYPTLRITWDADRFTFMGWIGPDRSFEGSSGGMVTLAHRLQSFKKAQTPLRRPPSSRKAA